MLSTLSQSGLASDEWKLYKKGETLSEDIIGAPPSVAALVAKEEEIQRTEKEVAQAELAEIRPLVTSLEEQVQELMAGIKDERVARQRENKALGQLMEQKIKDARKQGIFIGIAIPVLIAGIAIAAD
jgi:ElaB/YqjD/DUF883 family membrane-anchored ribosome-binding protein